MSLNPDYELSDNEIDVLELFKEHGRLRPVDVYEDLGFDASSGHHYINRLNAAGWISKPTRGLYQFECDPRELDDEEIAKLYVGAAVELSDESSVAEMVESATARTPK